jgi:glycosyltransferase involved in cell wall biosynthesis
MSNLSNTKLNILQVCSSGSWGGMEMHVADLAKQLMERGHNNLILTTPNSKLAAKAKEENIPVKVEKIGGYVQPLTILRLKSFLKKNQFDLIVCHYGRDLWTIIPAKKMSQNTPLILVKHIGTQKPKKDIFHRFLYKNVNSIVANSNVIFENILNTHPVSEPQVRLIHLGIDQKKFYPNKEFRVSARSEFGIANNEFVVGITGRLQRWKGYFEFLETAAVLTKKYPKIKFMAIGGATVGEHAEAEEINKKADSLNLENRLIFTGFRNDVPRLLNALDLFVFPSYAEAYGLALLEAMAVGLPVVASNCDGVLDIVENEKTGLLISPRNSEQLSKAVERLFCGDKMRNSVAKAGHEQYLEKFTSQLMLDKLENLYFQLYENK